MNCPECKKGEIDLWFEMDYSNPTESIEVRGDCEVCGVTFFTFLKVKDLEKAE